MALALAATALALLAAACAGGAAPAGGRDEDGPPKRIKVVTTLALLADFVRQVGGQRVEVFPLLSPGADPHTYEPTPRDIQRVTQADIAFANGLGLEPAALRAIKPNLPPDAPLVLLGEEALAAAGRQAEGENPHLWLDLAYARRYAAIIRDRLSQIDPGGAAAYRENYRRFSAQLEELDAYVRGQVAAIPPERRKLVTTHDAFRHLARYLGLKLVAFVAAGPGQEPSPRDVAALARAIEEEGVPAAFLEPQIGAQGRVLRQAAADAGVPVCTLYSDALDDRVTGYVELMRFDAQELARCLGGTDD